MKKIYLAVTVAIVAVVCIIAAGCNSGGSTKTETKPSETEQKPAETTGTTGSSTGEAKQSAAIEIANSAFSSAEVTVAKGGKVTWTNKDSVEHTVTGDNQEFDSGQIGQNKSFSKTFDQTGTFDYHCANHPSMTGTVVVK